MDKSDLRRQVKGDVVAGLDNIDGVSLCGRCVVGSGVGIVDLDDVRLLLGWLVTWSGIWGAVLEIEVASKDFAAIFSNPDTPNGGGTIAFFNRSIGIDFRSFDRGARIVIKKRVKKDRVFWQ